MKRRILMIVMLSLFFALPVQAIKPPPPAQLIAIFSEVIEIEDSVSEQEWQNALQTVQEISELVTQIAPSIRSTTGDSGYEKLIGSVTQLRHALEGADSDVTSKALLKMQKHVFQTMEFYQYQVHPSFAIVKAYVDEALEAAEGADFERVAHEMKEVATVMSSTAKVMGEKGVGKGMRQDFLDQLFLVIDCASDKKQPETLTALKKMEVLARAFVWMGQQQ